jgi:hypothetical protein
MSTDSAPDAGDCQPGRIAAHKELGRCLRSVGSVEAVDFLLPSESASGRPETEVVAAANRRGTLPNSVALKIVASGLAVATVRPANNPDFVRVVVR